MSESYNTSIAAIVLAGGRGTRFNGKKQFLMFHDKPLWKHVFDKTAMFVSPNNICVVGIDVPGGETRSKSVSNGLNALELDYEKVLILEAARPLVSEEQIEFLITTKSPSITFVAPCVDTIILKDKTYLDRNNCLRLLTPQAFDYKLLKRAYATGKYHDMTDETRVLFEEYQILPTFLDGNDNLFKVTYPKDIAIIEELYKQMIIK